MPGEVTRELLTVIDGPKGKAEIFEVIKPSPPEMALEGQLVEYEVKFGSDTQTFAALGEAYVTAGELSGTKT
jgi:hypothetical protein